MKQVCLFLFFFQLIPFFLFSQDDSTIQKRDTNSIRTDTNRIIQVKPDTSKPKRIIQPVPDTTNNTDTTLILNNSLFLADSLRRVDSLRSIFIADSLKKMTATQQTKRDDLKDGITKNFEGKELLFYFLVLLLIIFGFLRRAFPKYFSDLFRVFFRTTLKQRQTQEQLLQSPLPSIFMNSFFVVSFGMYINFILVHFQLIVTENFWLQYLYCVGALSAIYSIKFIGLKITGWLFNVRNATESYIFIVFIINKMIGIFLIPLLLLIAFTPEPLYGIALVISWIGISILLIYRFILSYSAVHKDVKLNSFHFILYIVGFEIVPLLLIYKLLLLIF